MIRSIASRKAIATIFTAAWSIFGAQSGYSQPVAEGKIYWTHPESGIHRSSLDGSNVEQLVIPDLRRPDKIALDIAGGKMYWTERAVANIHRSDLDGSNVETLIEGYGPPTWNWITDIALDVAGGKMYWTEGISHGDYIEGIVARANLDGSNTEGFSGGDHTGDIALDLVRGKVYWTDSDAIVQTDLSHFDGADFNINIYDHVYIVSSGSSSITLDADGGKIYWTDADAGRIYRADLDGQSVEEVLTVSEGYPEEIILLDVDGGQIYWTNPGTQTIQRADLDGQNREHFFDLSQLHLTGSLAGIALDLDGNKIYWTNPGTQTIQRADLDGQNREVLFDPIERRPHGIALGMDKIYWTDAAKGTIHRADLKGQNREVLITGLDEPRGIALTAGSKIYWADSGTGKIQEAGLDGSPVKDIVIGLDHPSAIALDEDRAKIYWKESDNYPWATSQFFRSNLDGSHIEDVPISTVASSNIALDEDRAKIYWTGTGSNDISPAIFRSDLDGSHIEKFDVLDWAHSIGAIALDLIGNKIYWTALLDDPVSFSRGSPSRSLQIYRSNLDGSNVERIFSEETDRYGPPTGIALYIPHPTSISTPITTPAIPTTSGLAPNFPNPFNASTQIAYRLASPGPVRLEIYNVLGQPVRTLVNQFQPAGFYQVRWDARDQRGAAVAAGVYLTHLRHPDGAQTRRLLYLK
ncbi:MAG: T9SS type A sorting domain-containing protein [Candidatus Latescibacteria bacterium]|nr:T9SS type A sorting domain-containing protein [Candidatus Latescibacterota bacterium]